MVLDAGQLLDEGLVALPEALAEVHDQTRGRSRVISVRMAGGLAVDVLPDRGLDLGSAWWRDLPLAWRSPNPVDPGPGFDWEARFLGGLLATCGPDNIGERRNGAGQHGTHHGTVAHEVSWQRHRRDSELEVRVRGRIGHTSLAGPRIIVEREITLVTGRAEVRVDDVVHNVGDQACGVPLLYHINLGAPLLRPGSRLEVAGPSPATREPLPPGRQSGVLPQPARGLVPVVAEHHPVPSDDGVGHARLIAGRRDPVVEVTWTAETLPRLNTWTWPAQGAWVLGIEPSNAPLFGPERDQDFAGAPVLQPGARWHTGVSVLVREQEPA